MLVNVARAIGPAVAGMLIATVGDGVCFLVNAASFVAVVGSLATMDVRGAEPEQAHAARAQGQLREGLRYVRSKRELLVPLVMMGDRRLPHLRVPGVAAGDGQPAACTPGRPASAS